MHYQENQYKAYGLIWERCTTAMKAKIKAQKGFEDGIISLSFGPASVTI